MYGLVLEGGGARGSYHVGAYRALIEEGVPIKGVVGTSIGALNGAMIVQGDHDKCYDLWKKITYSMVVDVNDEEIEKLMELKPNRENFSFIKEKMKKFIGDRGFDITPLKDLLEEYIDEEKIRNSGIDFGIVTVSLSELKPLYIFLEDIPEGELTHYLLASAYLPFFKSEKLGGKRYLDGGFYDNLPYRMLVEKGYKDLILVRTHAMGITKRINLPKEKTIIISPSAGIGSAMEYDSVQAQENIKMGYYDGLRQIKNLRGSEYYVLPMKNKDYYIKYLLNLKEEQIREMERILKIQGGDSKRSLFEEIIPKIASLMSLDNNYGYEDILIHLLEKKAEKCNIDRYNLYTFEELLSKVKDTNASVEKEEVSTIEKIIENIEILPIINKNEALLEIADIVFSKK